MLYNKFGSEKFWISGRFFAVRLVFHGHSNVANPTKHSPKNFMDPFIYTPLNMYIIQQAATYL